MLLFDGVYVVGHEQRDHPRFQRVVTPTVNNHIIYPQRRLSGRRFALC